MNLFTLSPCPVDAFPSSVVHLDPLISMYFFFANNIFFTWKFLFNIRYKIEKGQKLEPIEEVTIEVSIADSDILICFLSLYTFGLGKLICYYR